MSGKRRLKDGLALHDSGISLARCLHTLSLSPSPLLTSLSECVCVCVGVSV